MYEVFRHWDTATVGLLNNLLQDAGVPTILQNWDGCNITEIPIPAIYPTICVAKEEDSKRAKEIITAFQKHSTPSAGEWTCPSCDERVEQNFSECWNCSRTREIFH